jgi:CBS domain containing-hemolysin-like protein
MTWQLVSWLIPVCERIEGICERVLKVLLPSRIAPVPHLTDDELETLVEIGRDEGTLNETESKILRAVLRLEGKPAKHCMTPRVDAFFISDDLTNEEAVALLRLKRLRRVPVRGQKTDDVEGILDAKGFLLDPSAPYTERLQVPSFVPGTMKALDLLQAFLTHRQHLAVLLDEYGGVEGIVTLSDIVEELLGEEGPDPASELYIERLGPNRLIAAGSARLDDVEDALGCSFQTSEIDSIGGLVIDTLGMLPRPGAQIEIDGWTVSVRRATRKRIKEVLIEPTRPVDGTLNGGMDGVLKGELQS